MDYLSQEEARKLAIEMGEDPKDVLRARIHEDGCCELEMKPRGPWPECPECGTSMEIFMNVGNTHWFYCVTHKKKAVFGAKIFSSWKQESEEDWKRNWEFLSKFETVE